MLSKDIDREGRDAVTGSERETQRTTVLKAWAQQKGVDLNRLDLGQQWVVFGALQLIALFDAVPALRRLVGYFLANCRMGIGATVIAAVVGVSDRAVRQARALSPPDMLHSVRHPVGGHRKPKLKAKHAGVVAKFLADRPKVRVREILDHIRCETGVEIDRLTLRRYLKRYGLGCLRGERVAGPTPLFSAARALAEHSS
jgi:transposase